MWEGMAGSSGKACLKGVGCELRASLKKGWEKEEGGTSNRLAVNSSSSCSSCSLTLDNLSHSLSFSFSSC